MTANVGWNSIFFVVATWCLGIESMLEVTGRILNPA